VANSTFREDDAVAAAENPCIDWASMLIIEGIKDNSSRGHLLDAFPPWRMMWRM